MGGLCPPVSQTAPLAGTEPLRVVRNDAVVTLNRGGLEAEALDEKSQ